MKGQSFPLVPRDKRSFTVTRRLPNSLRVSVCARVCVAFITCEGAQAGKRVLSALPELTDAETIEWQRWKERH